MAVADDISIRIKGRAGRITLTRPQALNALTWDMLLEIEKALELWALEPGVEIILLDSLGDRAFCAGGDVEELYRHGIAGDFSHGRRFWRDEYRINALIANHSKPIVAFLQGYTMGGGVGIGCHGNFRIVCENSQVAMPECAIGLVPDVGGSFLLAHAPKRVGEYLGLTGIRMDAANAVFAGFADTYVPASKWESLKSELCSTGDPDRVDAFSEHLPAPTLERIAGEVERIFKQSSLTKCLDALAASKSEWAVEAVKHVERNCPLSVACAWEIIRRARSFKRIEQALELEYRFTSRALSDGEFLEGVRAQVIDKDRRPVWKTKRIEDVEPETIARMLAPVE
jgi:enoyl-CoA hydratase/carnithine racemase